MRYNKVTISGRICAGKTTLFWGLQRQLAWPTFSASAFFRDYARTHQLSLELAEEQNEKLTKEVDYRLQTMLKAKGKLIAEGWMAGIMADEFPRILRVLLTCAWGVRVRRFANREGVSLTEAERKIKLRERSLLSVLEKIYQRDDFLNPNHYNFILDTTHLSPKAVIEQVLSKLSSSP